MSALLATVGWRQIMKLNKYLYKKFTEEHEEFVIPSENWPFTEEDIEEWYSNIVDILEDSQVAQIANDVVDSLPCFAVLNCFKT